MHAFERMDEDIEIEPILEDLDRPSGAPLDVSLDDDTQAVTLSGSLDSPGRQQDR